MDVSCVSNYRLNCMSQLPHSYLEKPWPIDEQIIFNLLDLHKTLIELDLLQALSKAGLPTSDWTVTNELKQLISYDHTISHTVPYWDKNIVVTYRRPPCSRAPLFSPTEMIQSSRLNYWRLT